MIYLPYSCATYEAAYDVPSLRRNVFLRGNRIPDLAQRVNDRYKWAFPELVEPASDYCVQRKEQTLIE